MTSPTLRLAGRWLEPFAASFWILFLLWTALVAVVWTLQIGEVEVLEFSRREFHLPPMETGGELRPMQAILVSFLKWIEPVWAVLAMANVYGFTAAREGLDVARRWAGVILASVALIAWVSAKTAWPLGPIRYTGNFGPRLGPVPLGLPLLWLAAMLGARDLALRLRPALSQIMLALVVGMLCLLFEIALEPIASKVQVFWLWPPGSLPAHLRAPVQSYATWFCLSAVLTWFLKEKRLVTLAPPVTKSPAAVYVLLLAVLLLANLATWRS